MGALRAEVRQPSISVGISFPTRFQTHRDYQKPTMTYVMDDDVKACIARALARAEARKEAKKASRGID